MKRTDDDRQQLIEDQRATIRLQADLIAGLKARIVDLEAQLGAAAAAPRGGSRRASPLLAGVPSYIGGLVVGHRYRVVFKLGQQKRHRVMVGTYLGPGQDPRTTDWNLRPAAGTTTMPWDAEVATYEETTEPHSPPRPL